MTGPSFKRVALIALAVVGAGLFVGWAGAGIVSEFVGAYRHDELDEVSSPLADLLALDAGVRP